jgi:ubiquinone/menaquinone biosynthesis C-methylase UbiE
MAAFALGVGLSILLRPGRRRFARILLHSGLWGGLLPLAIAGGLLWSSRVGKLQARDRLLEAIPWRGDETVLDVGCGRGLLLIGAAKRLVSGKAVGIDIWQGAHHADNRPEATWENARIEGVAERVEIEDGDMRQLPFQDRSFDVVLSSLVLHNIEDRSERAGALEEMVRVLKPGGYLALMDILYINEYIFLLRKRGIRGIRKVGPRFLFFLPTYIVVGHL